MKDFHFGWWTTGRDQAAVNLFNTVWQAVEKGTIKGRFAYLFCSRNQGEGHYSDRIMSLAKERDIPVERFSAVKFQPELRKKDRDQWRTLYHRQVYQRIKDYQCSLAVLAGYMWVLSPEVCQKIDAINLHPALPGGPTGTWQEVIWKLLEKREKETGAMMHLVTPELDRGPAITFFSFPIEGGAWTPLWQEFDALVEEKGLEGVMKDPGENLPLFQRIRHQGEIRELPLIVQTLRALSKQEIILSQGQLLDSAGRPIRKPLDLSELVNACLVEKSQ